MELFLGVDGGGTRSTFVLIDASGAIRGRAEAGCAYYPQVGLEGVRQTFSDGIERLLKAAGLNGHALTYGFFAVPAYGEDSKLIATLDALPAGLLAADRYCCGNDMVSGWAGAFGGRDGINVVAGTGSIAYGEFETRFARAGGWGEVFSDEGSAYWIAKEGLSLFSKMSDGRAPAGPLLELVRRHLHLEVDLDLCAAVYGDSGGARSDVAGFAPLMSRAAEAGDSQVQAIFERAAQELVALVTAVRTRLAVPETVSLAVSYSGGMFRNSSPVLARFRDVLTQSVLPFTLANPEFPPTVGAALYAARRGGYALDAAALARLAHECLSWTD